MKTTAFIFIQQGIIIDNRILNILFENKKALMQLTGATVHNTTS